MLFLGYMQHALELISSNNNKISRIYCYGLGRLSTAIARYQTAFILIVKDGLAIDQTALFDPVFTDKEKIVLKRLGLSLEDENRKCKIRQGYMTCNHYFLNFSSSKILST